MNLVCTEYGIKSQNSVGQTDSAFGYTVIGMLCMLTDRVPRYALFLGAGYDWSMGQTGELSPVSRVKLRDWNPRDLTTR